MTSECCRKEIVSTITSKGRVTIPAEVRRYLGVASGDTISFVITDSGAVELKVTSFPTVASLRERGPAHKTDLSYHEMKEIAYADRLAAQQRFEI
jgi:AbrB family looped-hinge helix DNA binding protein